MAERLELGSKAEHLLDLALRAAATGGPQIPPASPPARPDTSTMQMPFERPHRACSRPNIFLDRALNAAAHGHIAATARLAANAAQHFQHTEVVQRAESSRTFGNATGAGCFRNTG